MYIPESCEVLLDRRIVKDFQVMTLWSSILLFDPSSSYILVTITQVKLRSNPTKYSEADLHIHQWKKTDFFPPFQIIDTKEYNDFCSAIFFLHVSDYL